MGNDDAICNNNVHQVMEHDFKNLNFNPVFLQATQMIRGLLISEYSPGIHFFTLNMEVATTQIAKNISLWLGMKKPLPFSLSADPDRTSKEVSEIKIKRRKQVSFS